MIAGGLWSDDAIEIVLSSLRHSGTKASFAPYHWAVLHFARVHTVPSDSSLFDLSPGENSDFFDNYFSRCRSCQKRWWLVDTPVLGICPVCEIEVIRDALDVKGTLEASPHAPIVRRPAADIVMEPQRAEVVGGEQDVDLEEDEDVTMIIPDTIWAGSTIETNPNFDLERYRGWIDLLALDFTRMNQRRPDNPRLLCPMDKDPDLLPDPRGVKMELDDEDASDDNVIVDNKYDSSVASDSVLSGFVPSITPLLQSVENKGIDRLGNLSSVKHVIVVGPFSSGTNAMCSYIEKYFDVVIHPPRKPPNATGWIGDMSAPNYSRKGNSWQVGWKHMPPLNSESATRVLPPDSLLIQMIREPLSWVKSLVKSHYSMVPDSGLKRGGGRWDWLAQSIKLDTDENEFRECVFSSAIDLWACYAHGYLSGRYTAGETTDRTTIVRHEDLVTYPTRVIAALESKGLKRRLVNNVAPTVTPIDEYVGGYRGTLSSSDVALRSIREARYIEPCEMRHWVVTQIQRRSTLTGLLGYIPHSYAMLTQRPMVWLYYKEDPVSRESLLPAPPLTPAASGGNASARGGAVLANAGYALPGDRSIVDWLNDVPGSVGKPVSLGGGRSRDTRSDPDHMDTSTDRDIVPWQLQDIPPRLVPGLLTYAEVVRRTANVSEFSPIYTRPRPANCLIHASVACNQCHLCIETHSWDLEQKYARRLAAIHFDGADPADKDGDVMPSRV